MKIRYLSVSFENTEISRRDVPKIRGYIASKFPEFLELHNHLDTNHFIYKYPLIQYKGIRGTPYLIGLNEGVDILYKVENLLEDLSINNEVIDIFHRNINFSEKKFGLSEDILLYRFVTPWMALNQKNYKKYNHADNEGKTELLKKILTGNLLSMSKFLGYSVEKPINVLVKLEPITVNFKNNKMIAFKGEFMVNFLIPDYLGLGKSVSRGFGTVVRIRDGVFK